MFKTNIPKQNVEEFMQLLASHDIESAELNVDSISSVTPDVIATAEQEEAERLRNAASHAELRRIQAETKELQSDGHGLANALSLAWLLGAFR